MGAAAALLARAGGRQLDFYPIESDYMVGGVYRRDIACHKEVWRCQGGFSRQKEDALCHSRRNRDHHQLGRIYLGGKRRTSVGFQSWLLYESTHGLCHGHRPLSRKVRRF
ncbi:hypothetical protein SDC9_140104 [bioreactor metagenome]|uniref:Uncharacterized protein n=1 Tax=bioreactor metagenome TaxID=1076179 RepID=A0A645DV10_9ZZZZ